MDKKQERPESYPKPSESDRQLEQQNEFIDQRPNDFDDKAVGNVSTKNEGGDKESNSRKEGNP